MGKEESKYQEEPLGSNSINGDTHKEEETVVVKKGRKWSRFPITVEPILFLFCVADSLSGSVTHNFILTRTCEVHFHYNKSVCSQLGGANKNDSDIEALVQPYTTVILTSMNFLSIFFSAILSMFLGPWSDSNGRKLMLIFPGIGYSLKFLLLAVFSLIPNLNPYFGLVAELPVSLSGGVVNLITASYSYISDITTPENRSFRISILESGMYLGSIIGMLSTSPIFNAGEDHGYLLVFGLSSGMLFLATTFVCLFLPESVQTTENGKGVFHMFDLTLVKETIGVCFKKREGYRSTVIFLVIISLTSTISAMVGESNVIYLFTRLKFNWSIPEFTMWSSINMACGFVGLLLGTSILSKWLKVPDPIIGVISYVLKVASAFYIAFIPPSASYLMYYAGLVNPLGGLSGPAGRAVLSKSVSSKDLGKIFALTGSSEALFPLAFAPLYTWLYNSTIKTFPSAFMLLTGSLHIMSSIFYVIIAIIERRNPPTTYDGIENEHDGE